jgi:hypothetical protein
MHDRLSLTSTSFCCRRICRLILPI